MAVRCPTVLVRFAVVAITIAVMAPVDSLAAQSSRRDTRSRAEATNVISAATALDHGRFAVVIDVDRNRLYFKQGDLTLWSAPVGTGTGFRVITDDDDWNFSTPNGQFEVQYKELDPVWIAPDWFFVENNLPVPSVNHPSRYMKQTLGDAAIYISPDLAIHGTNRPELIGQRVSHGCIRLENRYARRLYNSVQVGTEVIIVGGREIEEGGRTFDLREGYDPTLASKRRPPPPPRDPVYAGWERRDTEDLVDLLADELAEDEDESRWDEVAGILLNRVRGGDWEALDGLFGAATEAPSRRMQREFGTFLAEAYRAQRVASLEALSRVRTRDQRRLADMIVLSSVALFRGDYASPSAPWPTSLLQESMLTRRARPGWDVLRESEREYRERLI